MDSFALLEEKVRKAAALVRDLRRRNAGLEADVSEARKRTQRLEEELPELRTRVQELMKALQAAEKVPAPPPEEGRRLAAAEKELGALRQEREEVRQRIARLIETLDGLE